LAALQDIEPAQLLLFVQSFGIPVASMSRLLKCLDNIVTSDPDLIEGAVEDKAYMAQLIEIQHMRGVVGGDIFYKLVTKSIAPRPESTGRACFNILTHSLLLILKQNVSIDLKNILEYKNLPLSLNFFHCHCISSCTCMLQ
jgi:integrator complex subunit 1